MHQTSDQIIHVLFQIMFGPGPNFIWSVWSQTKLVLVTDQTCWVLLSRSKVWSEVWSGSLGLPLDQTPDETPDQTVKGKANIVPNFRTNLKANIAAPRPVSANIQQNISRCPPTRLLAMDQRSSSASFPRSRRHDLAFSLDYRLSSAWCSAEASAAA